MGLAWMPAKRIWGKTNLGVMASCRKPLRRKRAKAQSLRRQAVKDGLAPAMLSMLPSVAKLRSRLNL